MTNETTITINQAEGPVTYVDAYNIDTMLIDTTENAVNFLFGEDYEFTKYLKPDQIDWTKRIAGIYVDKNKNVVAISYWNDDEYNGYQKINDIVINESKRFYNNKVVRECSITFERMPFNVFIVNHNIECGTTTNKGYTITCNIDSVFIPYFWATQVIQNPNEYTTFIYR